MFKNQEYLTVVGMFLLIGVCIIMFSTPEDIFSSVIVIDVSKTHRTPYEILVTTVFDFKNNDELKNLPKNISGLHSRDVPITKTEREMGAMVKRMYSNETDGVLFMILSSQNMSAFHSMEVCYGVRWNITENKVISIKTSRLGEVGFHDIHVKKFIVRQRNLDMIVLHWFMWEGGLVRTDKDFMLIQVGTSVKESREEATELAKRFTRDFFLRMYKPVTKSKIISQQIMDKYGLLGLLINIILITVPLAMIFNAKIRVNRDAKK